MTTSEILMTPDPVTCRARDCGNQAARLMWEHDIGALPVVDDDGRLCGMITDRDLCMAAYIQGKPLAAIPVETAMAPDVAFAEIGDTMPRVQSMMAERQVRRIPVVDADRRPIGIVSLNDLARRSADATGALVPTSGVAATLHAICTPHNLPTTPQPHALIARTEPRGRTQIAAGASARG